MNYIYISILKDSLTATNNDNYPYITNTGYTNINWSHGLYPKLSLDYIYKIFSNTIYYTLY